MYEEGDDLPLETLLSHVSETKLVALTGLNFQVIWILVLMFSHGSMEPTYGLRMVVMHHIHIGSSDSCSCVSLGCKEAAI